MQDKYVLGITCLTGTQGMGHDPSAALLKNGEIVALTSEERFNRIKKSPARFPHRAIKFCLDHEGISIKDVSCIGWYCNPDSAVEIWKKGKYQGIRQITSVIHKGLSRVGLPVSMSEVFTRKQRAIDFLNGQFFRYFGITAPKILFVNHHLSHMASSFYTSGMKQALCVAWDTGGDLLSAAVGIGRGQDIRVIWRIPYSQMSMGAFYKLFQRYINLSDEGSLMGLAAYGKPKGLLDRFVDIESLKHNRKRLYRHVYTYSTELLEYLGPQRMNGEPITDRHMSIAADVQNVLERFAFKILKTAQEKTGLKDLCLAGGVALNATINGKIARSGMFDNIFVHPNAGDGGCALGSAFMAYRSQGGMIRNELLKHVYWGRGFSEDECERVLKGVRVRYTKVSDTEIPEVVADLLVAQKIIGWCRGRSEWGPRALGARSIIADPRTREMQDRVNGIIKYRDEWRPFAPSMLVEAAPEYLENSFFSPFMLYTFKVRPEKKDGIAAVVHADETTRPQMVVREINPVYYDTIKCFGEKTGVSAILNTSFNIKGEPIVDSPIDAIKCFYGTGLDALVLGNFLLTKD